jgi:hypothetical protein
MRVPCGIWHRIEQVFNAAIGDDERQPLQINLVTGLEGRQT